MAENWCWSPALGKGEKAKSRYCHPEDLNTAGIGSALILQARLGWARKSDCVDRGSLNGASFPTLGSTPKRRGCEGEEARAALKVTVPAIRVLARMALCSRGTASVSFPV